MKEISNRIVSILVVVTIISILLQFSVYSIKYEQLTLRATAIGFVGLCIDNNPQIDEIPDQTAFVDIPYVYDVNTSVQGDINVTFLDDTYLFNISNDTGMISFTPEEDDVDIHYVNISVISSCGLLTDSEIMRLEIKLENQAPVLDAIPDFTINQSELFVYDVNATDPDNDTLFFGDDTSMFQINSGTGVIYFTPSQDEVGNTTVVIWVMDEYGALDWQYVNFEIIDVNDPPILQTIGAQTAIIYENYTYDVNATDVDVKPEWNNISFYDNATFFNISSGTGIIHFYANDTLNGSYSVHISVTDSELWDFEIISFSVVFVNHAPNITSWYPLNDTIEMEEGESQYFNISKFDLDGTTPSTQWYLDGSLLTGETADEYTYYAGYSSSGTRNVTVIISDGLLTDSHEWSVEVEDVPQEAGGSIPPSAGAAPPPCAEEWRCGEWSVCPSYEIQTRECSDINSCGTEFYRPDEMRACVYVPEPTCDDGVVNCHDGGCEIWIDCGGPCPPCPTCSDRIKNCHKTKSGGLVCEDGIDCGGPCPPCPEGIPTVCGDGVCEEAELFTCIPDCGLFFGEFLLIVIILGAGSVLIYRGYAAMMVAYRKRRPPPYTNMQLLGTSTIRKLHLLQLEIGKKKIRVIASEFSAVMREFFVKRFRIQKKFTYIELTEVARRGKVGKVLGNRIADFSMKMTEIEYSHVEPSVSDIAFVIKSAITIVEMLTGVKMRETFGKKAGEEMKRIEIKKEEVEMARAAAPVEEKMKYRMTIKDKAKMKILENLISEGERAMANHNISEAERIYSRIRDIYDSIPPGAKRKFYEETIRIIKLYNGIMKGLE